MTDAAGEDIAACAGLVARGDADRFLAVMAASPPARDVLFPIYAFNVEVARAPWVPEESMIAEMRLQWWRDAVDEIGAHGAVRKHEVVTPLAGVLDATGAAVLAELVEARRWDIYRAPFADAAQFDDYLEKTAGGLTFVAARALGPVEESVARQVGYALGLANWFRAIPELEARGRVPLVDGRPGAVAELARAGLARLRAARRQRGAVSRAAGQALLAGWQAEAVLRQAAEAPERVKDGALGQSEFARKAGLMWRAMSGRW